MTCSICKQKGHQKKVCPTKGSVASGGGSASTSMPAAVFVSVPSRRTKQRKKSCGFGVYINQDTGAQILNYKHGSYCRVKLRFGILGELEDDLELEKSISFVPHLRLGFCLTDAEMVGDDG
nr:uncharacterized protein LOC109181378 [Ipomoea batatas]